ncbi:MAG TPA: hypothetical protein VGR26_07490 [Acidimicrobiales bacterium]|nr:hypothetical protein [Acidimicrobiales bacterium]
MKQQLMYLDAGTGSLIVSVVVAGAAGLGVILRLTWRRIVGFFSPKRRAEQRAQEQEAAEQRAAEDPAVPVDTRSSAALRD